MISFSLNMVYMIQFKTPYDLIKKINRELVKPPMIINKLMQVVHCVIFNNKSHALNQEHQENNIISYSLI